MKQLIGLFMACCLSLAATAEQIDLPLPNTLVASADYLKGDGDKPVVLILHGFLQTYNFPTVHRLADGLHSEGYSVLAPSLSLGVTYRKQSLACEAIHTHTLQDDVKEIAFWIDWLKQQGHERVVLVGHSTGSLELIAYLAGGPDPAVQKMVAISMVEGRFELAMDEYNALRDELRSLVARGENKPVMRHFSFCSKLFATPSSLVSYLDWSPDVILRAIRESSVPITIVMGSKDDRLGADWPQHLRKTGRKVQIIEGANHFMDGVYEFDLLDAILEELAGS